MNKVFEMYYDHNIRNDCLCSAEIFATCDFDEITPDFLKKRLGYKTFDGKKIQGTYLTPFLYDKFSGFSIGLCDSLNALITELNCIYNSKRLNKSYYDQGDCIVQFSNFKIKNNKIIFNCRNPYHALYILKKKGSQFTVIEDDSGSDENLYGEIPQVNLVKIDNLSKNHIITCSTSKRLKYEVFDFFELYKHYDILNIVEKELEELYDEEILNNEKDIEIIDYNLKKIQQLKRNVFKSKKNNVSNI